MAVEEAQALAVRDGHNTKNSTIDPTGKNINNGDDADIVVNAKGLQDGRCFSFVKIKFEPSPVVKFARQFSSRGFGGSSRRGGGGGSSD
ncbi:hypothetical protein MKW94_024604 [Papaver nudicaule]|uniref:Uncharacterized protein n=1 Tax=Papaver nudicaule TaxID=74823 RepID=A0AA41SAR9_PAPNU|nr:hypothetical protein [Papaver nudicaule]